MAFYASNHPSAFKSLAAGGTLLLSEKQTQQSGDLNNPGWEITDVYQGHPTVILNARNNPLSVGLPDPSWIKEVSTKEQGPIWELTVKYGNIDLLSTWTLDSNMLEPRISTHPNAIILDKARPGWTNMIEMLVDNHRMNRNYEVFNFDQVKMISSTQVSGSNPQGGLQDAYPFAWHYPLPDGSWIYPVGYGIDVLNQFAARYAQAWLLGQEAYQEPQWVIRNEVTVTAAFNFALWPLLFRNVNAMLNPVRMLTEPLLVGESIPGGIVVPGVPYWHKQPIQKTQTTQNQFIINREWYGRYWFNEFTYNLAS